MVNRTKISKEIRRRTGGVSKTGNGTKVKDIRREDWEKIPGTGGSPHNPPRYRLTAEAKKRQQTQFKLKQAKKREQVTDPAVRKLYKGVKEGAPYARLTGAVRRGSERAEKERLRKAGSLDRGHPRTPVKREPLAPPKGYKRSPEIPSREEDIELPAIPDLPKDETWEERAIRLGYKTLGDLTKPRKRGGSLKKKKKKKKYSAGGRVSYQGHDGNKLVSKYYS